MADPLRIAFFHTELSRDGPGLLLRDIERAKDDQVKAVLDVITRAAPHVVVLAGIDWDLDNRAALAFQSALAANGLELPHVFSGAPNRGVDTGLDLDGNGRLGEPRDAHGYGEFTGQNGLAVLSRWPILTPEVEDFSEALWADQPDALLPYDGQPDGLNETLRLSSTNHWLVPIDTAAHGELMLGTFFATTPVFDGPEDRNGRRNHDEVAFWTNLLANRDMPNIVIAGHTNLDPERGDGRRVAIQNLIRDRQLQDPAPTGAAGTATVDWRRDDLPHMRVSYVLPGTSWQVVQSGVWWPETGTEDVDLADAASRHRLVWMDLEHR